MKTEPKWMLKRDSYSVEGMARFFDYALRHVYSAGLYHVVGVLFVSFQEAKFYTAPEIANMLVIPKSTVQEYLLHLETEGFARRIK